MIARALSLTPQAKTVYSHLNRVGHITPLKAFSNYQITRLASCIHEIRRQGFNVITDIRKDESGHKYSLYSLTGALH